MAGREPTREQLIQDLAGARRRIGDMEAGQARLEERLRESEERFRAAFEQAGVGMAHVSRQGRFMLVNELLSELLGYSKEELSDKSMADVTHPEDIEASTFNAERLLRGEIAGYSMEKRYLRKDGSVAWVHLTASPVRKASGEPAYFIKVVEDITKKRQAQAALHRSEERFKALVENAPDIISEFDMAMRRTYVNPAITRLSSPPLSRFINSTLGEQGYSESFTGPFQAALRRVLDTGGERTIELALAGTARTAQFQIRIAPIRGPSGRIEGAMSVRAIAYDS